jgi:hypothetical protein
MDQVMMNYAKASDHGLAHAYQRTMIDPSFGRLHGDQIAAEQQRTT